MILQFRRFILSSFGFVLLAFFGQPLWTALHGALAKLPSPTQSLTTASAPVGDVASKNSLPSNQSYGKLPIYFERNLGQTDSQVKFIARGSGVATFLAATEAVFSLPQGRPLIPVRTLGIHLDPVTGDPTAGDELSLPPKPQSRLRGLHRHRFQSPESVISQKSYSIVLTQQS